MSAQILDGKALAQTIRAEVAAEVAAFVQQYGVTPSLAAVLVGADPASEVYVRNKRKACGDAGMESRLHQLPPETTTVEVLSLIDRLNADRAVHGILVQLPLPPQVDTRAVLSAVDPLKDVDCFHPENVGLLVQGRPRYVPATPAGVQQMLIRSGIQTAGRHVVILGRSEIVGKPLASLLMQRGEGGDATVTVCHSRTRDLTSIARTADILIAAIGRAKFVTADIVKPAAAVIDVGINRTPEGIVGDVDYEAVREVAGHITPVPGGVGPLTIAMLLRSTLKAAGTAVGQARA